MQIVSLGDILHKIPKPIMQIVSLENNLHKIINPVFREK